MILIKKLTVVEALNALAMVAAENLPKDLEGDISVTLDMDAGVEILFIEKGKELN